MDDLISRRAAIDALAKELYHNEEDYRTAVKAIGGLPSAQQTCGGYDIKKLVAFAIACQRAGVNEKDLKEFAQNCEFAWETMEKEFNKTLRETLGGIWNGV